MSNNKPISTLLLQAAGALVKSLGSMKAVYLEPASIADYGQMQNPCCAIYNLTESPRSINQVREAKALFQFEFYVKSDVSTFDQDTGLWISKASVDLDKLWADFNRAMFISSPGAASGIGNPMYAYAQLIEENLKQKFPGYDDNSVLVCQYDVTYRTVRGNGYQSVTKNITFPIC